MQLDLGFLNVTNKFEWHGGSKEDASSIHLDVLSAEVYISKRFMS
jgi:vacuolar protein sorting-associated protein 13A/C